MAYFLLDTHAWSWNLTVDPRLPPAILQLINSADGIHVSPLTFYEIAQKVRLGKWPEMAPYVERLPTLISQQKGHVASLTPQMAVLGASLEWDHRDPFDRMIAATAIAMNLPLISADSAFDALSDREDWPGRVW
ncbi:MAG: twitching motility protein PilT [Rhizobium sp.]|nr:twitching motility protein PilT [Rhizobium sp.]